MSEQKPRQPMCYACRSTDVEEVTYSRTFTPRKQVVEVPLLTTRCTNCGAEFTTGRQHDENLRRLADRRKHPAYKGLLLGEDIVGFRLRYGLTQRQAAKIFRAGKIAFSRYENEASYPDDRMASLLELAIAMPAALKHLADTAGVEIPLWEARCEDERKAKVKRLSVEGRARRQGQEWPAIATRPADVPVVEAWGDTYRPPAATLATWPDANSANDEIYQEAIAS